MATLVCAYVCAEGRDEWVPLHEAAVDEDDGAVPPPATAEVKAPSGSPEVENKNPNPAQVKQEAKNKNPNPAAKKSNPGKKKQMGIASFFARK